MMFCEFCETEIELTDGCVFLPKYGRHQLCRMPDGRVHQFLDAAPDLLTARLKAAGAFVAPRLTPPPAAPVEEVIKKVNPEEPASRPVEYDKEPITDEPGLDLDAAARELQQHFENPVSEPYHASAYVREQVSSERADDEIGNRV